MIRLIALLLSLAIAFACKKDDTEDVIPDPIPNPNNVPESIVSKYSATCGDDCPPHILRVELNSTDYYGISYDQCPFVSYFWKWDGTEIEIGSPLYDSIAWYGLRKEVVWECR